MHVIFGAGGHAKDLAAQLLREVGPQAIRLFVDEFAPGHQLMGIPVASLDFALKHRDASWLIALGDGQARQAVAKRLSDAGITFGHFVSRRAYVLTEHSVGVGSQIFANSVVSANVRIGAHVLINYNCSISHDAEVEDFATVSPGCVIAGRARLRRGCFLGAGATVKNGSHDEPLVIGEGAVIGAGACVISSIPPGATAVGVPARIVAGG